MSIPTPASTPGARPGPARRRPAGAGRPMDRTGGMENAHDTPRLIATASRRVSHTVSDGTERRPYAPQARSLYSPNTTSRVRSRTPVAKPMGGN